MDSVTDGQERAVAPICPPTRMMVAPRSMEPRLTGSRFPSHTRTCEPRKVAVQLDTMILMVQATRGRWNRESI
jgi:hypothetical protein